MIILKIEDGWILTIHLFLFGNFIKSFEIGKMMDSVIFFYFDLFCNSVIYNLIGLYINENQ